MGYTQQIQIWCVGTLCCCLQTCSSEKKGTNTHLSSKRLVTKFVILSQISAQSSTNKKRRNCNQNICQRSKPFNDDKNKHILQYHFTQLLYYFVKKTCSKSLLCCVLEKKVNFSVFFFFLTPVSQWRTVSFDDFGRRRGKLIVSDHSGNIQFSCCFLICPF